MRRKLQDAALSSPWPGPELAAASALCPLSLMGFWLLSRTHGPSANSEEQTKHAMYIIKASFQHKGKKMGFPWREGGKEGA